MKLMQRVARVVPLTMISVIVATPWLGAQQLGFALSAEKGTFVLGEPIVLRATVTNNGTQTANVVTIFDPTYGFARYQITRPDGQTSTFAPAWRDEGVARPTPLDAGQSAVDEVRIFYGAQGTTFDAAGAYVIVGEFGGLSSTPITIHVIQPGSADDQAASALMVDDEVTEFLFVGGRGSLTRAMDNLDRVRDRHASSVLAAYANYALGLYYSKPGRDYRTQRVRDADYGRAEAYLQTAMAAPLPPLFRIKVYQGIIQSTVGSEKLGTAENYLREFETQFRTDPLAARALQRIRRIMPQR